MPSDDAGLKRGVVSPNAMGVAAAPIQAAPSRSHRLGRQRILPPAEAGGVGELELGDEIARARLRPTPGNAPRPSAPAAPAGPPPPALAARTCDRISEDVAEIEYAEFRHELVQIACRPA